MSGAWCFDGTRIPISSVFGNLASGLTVTEYLEQFPDAGHERVEALLDFVGTRADDYPETEDDPNDGQVTGLDAYSEDSRRMCFEQGKPCIYELREGAGVIRTEWPNGTIDDHALETDQWSRTWPGGRTEVGKPGQNFDYPLWPRNADEAAEQAERPPRVEAQQGTSDEARYRVGPSEEGGGVMISCDTCGQDLIEEGVFSVAALENHSCPGVPSKTDDEETP